MKYYIYISNAKVDMLYPHIPQPLLKKISSSLSIDLKLLGAEVNIGAKGSPSDETRYAKVKIVSEYIEKHFDVGSIDAPSTYFKGTLFMQYGVLGIPNSSAIYFGGITTHTILGLSGSLTHVIGSKSNAGMEIPIPPSLLMGILPILISAHQESLGQPDALPLPTSNKLLQQSHAIAYMSKQGLSGTKQQLEFLAKTLLQGPATSHLATPQTYVVLGTPICVAIDD